MEDNTNVAIEQILKIAMMHKEMLDTKTAVSGFSRRWKENCFSQKRQQKAQKVSFIYRNNKNQYIYFTFNNLTRYIHTHGV